jgi:hypothetical protein
MNLYRYHSNPQALYNSGEMFALRMEPEQSDGDTYLEMYGRGPLTILEVTATSDGDREFIVSLPIEEVGSPDWTVALKTIATKYDEFNDGSDSFLCTEHRGSVGLVRIPSDILRAAGIDHYASDDGEEYDDEDEEQDW